ncbi:MAG TPA: CBS domain-containing protein [Chloroflexota bacterium]|jgi:CBS domain-containing protein
MKLRDVMTRNPEIVRPDATLEEAARKMDQLDIGPLPVCEGDRLVGLVTDRDITVRATAAGKDPRSTVIREAMTQDIVYCYEDQDVKDAARMMEDKQIRRLPVLSREQRLVGIVSLGDLATDTGDKRMTGRVLEQVSQPGQPHR